ncbi:hypothetical protein ACFV2X_04885 [Streptomyces sp. NPDC059679]|uniref:hypothetical protein n=1 Tax=Streptomyces sp. NPDC059679 TaxID=3346903 RepID=UPI0036879A59
MTGDGAAASCYILERQFSTQLDWTTFFVYNRRDHIRLLLTELFFDAEDSDRVESTRIDHVDNGETSDLWVIEGGRLICHVDLRPLIDVPDGFDPESDEGRIDWRTFDAAVPADLRGPLLGRGEELRLLDADQDFAATTSDLPTLYPGRRLVYGMNLWMNGELSDEPAAYFTDPDPS